LSDEDKSTLLFEIDKFKSINTFVVESMSENDIATLKAAMDDLASVVQNISNKIYPGNSEESHSDVIDV